MPRPDLRRPRPTTRPATRRRAVGRAARSRLAALAVVASAAGLAACGSGDDAARDTLPPIQTTSTTTTTTTTPDMRRIFYEVKPGDNLSDIAKRYQVTVQSIRELNGLTTDTLQIDQMLEIPNDIRVDATLPTLPSEASSDDSSDEP